MEAADAMTVKEFFIRAAIHIGMVALVAWSFTLSTSNFHSGSSGYTIIIAMLFVPGMVTIVMIFLPLENYLRKPGYGWAGLLAAPIISFALPSMLGWGPLGSIWSWSAAAWGALWMMTGALYWAFTPK